MPHHYVGDLPPTIGISGLSRVRTELLPLAVVPALPPHPVQMHGQLAGHGHLRDLSSTPHREVEKFTAPLRVTATLRTDISLFDDVDQLRWNGPTPAFEEIGARLDAARTGKRDASFRKGLNSVGVTAPGA